MWGVYAKEYYSAMKKMEAVPFAEAWMGLEAGMRSEESQKEKDKHHRLMRVCGL